MTYSTASRHRQWHHGRTPCKNRDCSQFIISELGTFVMHNAVLQLRKPTQYRLQSASFLYGSHSVKIFIMVTVQCMYNVQFYKTFSLSLLLCWGSPDKQGCKKGKFFPGFGAKKSVLAFSYCSQAHNHMQLQQIKFSYFQF